MVDFNYLADESKFDQFMRSKMEGEMQKAAATNRPAFGPQSKKRKFKKQHKQ